jgi:transcriptional regulator with XRE-family HTH domain
MMHDAATLLRKTRRRAGLTQAELAARAGVTQPVVSRAEAAGANPRIATLDRLLRAAGARLELSAPELRLPDVDEGQILERLRLPPAERLASFSASHRNVNDLLRRARRIDA